MEIFMRILNYWAKLVLLIHGKSIRGSKIDRNAFVSSGSNIVNSRIGRYTYCGYNCWIIETKIGSFCSIANDVKIGGPTHPIDWGSTSPIFYSGKNKFKKHFSEHYYNPFMQTVIENDVWIGDNTLVKAGVTIANGSVVGMGSVVTKDIGPYEVWAGNPAKLIKKRFSDDDIALLLEKKWWDLSDTELNGFAERITDIRQIIDKY